MFATPVQSASNKIATVPAPIGGLNARDSLAAMPETDAIVLQNFWPQPYGVSVRQGWQIWTTDPSSKEIGTLAAWSGADGQKKLFAWNDSAMLNVSSKNTVPPPILTTGITSAYWQTTGMSNASGGHLIAVDGQDDGIHYGPAGVSRLVAGDGIVVNTWKDLDPKEAIQVVYHHNRLWVTRKNSSVGYYLKELDAYYGDFGSFDFGPLFSKGGYLAFMATWTIDDGNGAEDHLVAVSSTGTAVVYQGLDPADPVTWKLVGAYFVGAPVLGRRSYTKVGGDLFLLTQQGIVSMSGMLASTKVNDQKMSFPSNKIQFLLSELIGDYGSLSNWQLTYVPKINMLICNIPSEVDGANTQLVSNQITNAWAQFTHMDATTWTTFDSQPFFADYAGNVCVAWEGYLDGVHSDGSKGTSVTAIAQQAYSYLGAFAAQKQVGMYRPTFIVGRTISYNSSIQYNFASTLDHVPDGIPDAPNPNGDNWGEGKWGQAKWYGGISQQMIWSQAQGIGVAASITLAVRSSGSALWVSTDYSYRVGSIL